MEKRVRYGRGGRAKKLGLAGLASRRIPESQFSLGRNWARLDSTEVETSRGGQTGKREIKGAEGSGGRDRGSEACQLA